MENEVEFIKVFDANKIKKIMIGSQLEVIKNIYGIYQIDW